MTRRDDEHSPDGIERWFYGGTPPAGDDADARSSAMNALESLHRGERIDAPDSLSDAATR